MNANAWLGLLRNPLAAFGFACVLTLVLCALLAPWLAPYDPVAIDVQNRLAAPSWAHPLGTDHLGRDVLSRLIVGSRVALTVAAVSLALSLVLGLAFGLLAGYGPRWVDHAVLLFFDVIYSFPTILLGLALLTLLGPSLGLVIAVIVVHQMPVYGRIVRTSTLALRNREFVLAERAMGAGRLRILARHVVPNLMAPLLVLAGMDVPAVIASEAGLSFLGMGLSPPAPSWGRILDEGYGVLREAPWVVLGAGVPLVLATLGFTFVGEALRDRLDPRQRARH